MGMGEEGNGPVRGWVGGDGMNLCPRVAFYAVV